MVIESEILLGIHRRLRDDVLGNREGRKRSDRGEKREDEGDRSLRSREWFDEEKSNLSSEADSGETKDPSAVAEKKPKTNQQRTEAGVRPGYQIVLRFLADLPQALAT
ncbi:hypothetical protein NDU88_004402 [Pleurodeles waltl]|uniref:Uncharacterized protein n=1 Tax=Pleurodeles waltl TaxID=8319 RepID=A0AAV7WWG3_PLEWA|nr:hypothetical protein NDU88_004402 [Pleurodeles waltl]